MSRETDNRVVVVVVVAVGRSLCSRCRARTFQGKQKESDGCASGTPVGPFICQGTMKVLVGCEVSGVVRDAFTAAGHDATSCDLLPSDRPGKHYQGDVVDILGHDWDLGIFFPPCTYLCVSGLHWNKRIPGRAALTEDALRFVVLLLNSPIPRIALENPIGIISTRIRKPDQIIQPYQFGHPESKQTALWLQGLPLLQPTDVLEPTEFQPNGRPRWSNQTPSGQNKLGPSADRAKLRSATYSGIAAAMADQWGSL